MMKGGLLFQPSVYLKLLRGELSQHLVIATTVGFGDQTTKLALAALELTIFQRFERVFYALRHGLRVGGGAIRIFCVLKSASQKNAAGFVGCGIERVRGNWSFGKRLQ